MTRSGLGGILGILTIRALCGVTTLNSATTPPHNDNAPVTNPPPPTPPPPVSNPTKYEPPPTGDSLPPPPAPAPPGPVPTTDAPPPMDAQTPTQVQPDPMAGTTGSATSIGTIKDLSPGKQLTVKRPWRRARTFLFGNYSLTTLDPGVKVGEKVRVTEVTDAQGHKALRVSPYILERAPASKKPK